MNYRVQLHLRGGDIDMSENQDFDFSSDESARESMKEFIKEQFPDELEGLDELLDQPDWYERLHDEFQEQFEKTKQDLPKNLKRLLDMLQ
jgi:hypothetical protein